MRRGMEYRLRLCSESMILSVRFNGEFQVAGSDW